MKSGLSVARAVLDTNVLVSAAVFPRSVPAHVLRRAAKDSFMIVTSRALLDELDDVLARKKFPGFDERKRAGFLMLIRKHADVVTPRQALSIISTDPDDNAVLEAAVAGKANFVVTGDRKHLLPLKQFRGIPIVAPRRFLELL